MREKKQHVCVSCYIERGASRRKKKEIKHNHTMTYTYIIVLQIEKIHAEKKNPKEKTHKYKQNIVYNT
jgi:hypothetical protein